MYSDKQFIFKAAWRLSKLYETALNALGREKGLTQSEMDVLIFLYSNSYLNTSRDIADHRSISKSLICKSVASLMKKGMVSGSHDKLDARMVRLGITTEGRAIAAELVLCCENLCDDLCVGLSESELRFFEGVVSRMQENGKRKYS